MFADIVGSTRLYEILGDKIAEELVSTTLRQLSAIVLESNGTIIKTIGDEVMCSFAQAEQALVAAKNMHEYLAEKTAPSKDYKLSIRVGAHQGPIIKTGNDIFGDAVNIAARIAGLARAGKTLITGYTHEQLADEARKRCQHFTQTTVKGKEQPIDIFDVIWEQTEELTCIVGNSQVAALSDILTLKFNDSVIKMSPLAIKSAILGRGQDCDLIIPSAQASRQHGRIECNRGKFIYSDNSANGSYISHNGIELFFHQEKVPLLGEGIISLGEAAENNSAFLLHYSIGAIKAS